MSLICNPKSAHRILLEETKFLRNGLDVTIAAGKAIEAGFKKYAEQFIDAAAELATVEKENIPTKIRELKDFLL